MNERKNNKTSEKEKEQKIIQVLHINCIKLLLVERKESKTQKAIFPKMSYHSGNNGKFAEGPLGNGRSSKSTMSFMPASIKPLPPLVTAASNEAASNPTNAKNSKNNNSVPFYSQQINYVTYNLDDLKLNNDNSNNTSSIALNKPNKLSIFPATNKKKSKKPTTQIFSLYII